MAATDFYLAGALDQLLRAAGLPVVSVTVGDPAVRATWTARLEASATTAQRTSAASLIAAFDVSALPTQLADAQATADVDRKELRAAMLALWEAIPAPTLTKVQLRARAIAIWKTL
jgi:hypothetical protein